MWRFDFGGDAPLIFSDPVETFTANRPEGVRDALRAAEVARRHGYWIAGMLSYEAANGLDDTLITQRAEDFPLVWLGAFGAPSRHADESSGEPYHLGDWEAKEWDLLGYRQRIGTIREAIRAGQTYQLNYTVRLGSAFSGSPAAWYEDLRGTKAGDFSAYLDVGQYAVLSLSPELFFRMHGSLVETRPMKGTAARGAYTLTDNHRRAALQQSEKERAENIMIVDLMRNDLSRLAQLGSVTVDTLCDVERYPTVWQLTSTVRAQRRPELTWADCLQTLFPSGSITGAPKVRTMELIRDLEQSPRGAYCGSLGYVTPKGDAVFNVAIRTVVVDRFAGRASFGTGGGITWDSDADAEYREIWAKAAFLDTVRRDVSLIETTRLQEGHLALLDYHTDRLKHAVEYFGWPWYPQRVRAAWSRLARHTGRWRVRLLYGPDGHVRTTRHPFQGAPMGVKRVAYARQAMPPKDAWTWHKTTRRERYSIDIPDQQPPVFDYILFNEEGEITEFTRGNLVLESATGMLLTPRDEAGLLPGTMRQWLLESGMIREARITRAEVSAAKAIWFINSVYGWVPVHLVVGTPL